jgi:hypothetical protein
MITMRASSTQSEGKPKNLGRLKAAFHLARLTGMTWYGGLFYNRTLHVLLSDYLYCTITSPDS